MTTLLILACALLIEGALGYPDALFKTIGHPVTWIGALIGWLDRRLNDPTRPVHANRRRGLLALLLLLAATLLPTVALQLGLLATLPRWPAIALLAILAATLPASRSLHRHVRAVADALESRGLAAGRRAVSHIVGRATDQLDEPAVIRAAIESLAENFSDGVVAPALWCALLGLPGIAAYKAINTADSMIGHRTPRHRSFGRAAARLDDWVNLPASRLAALWLILAAATLRDASPRNAIRIIRRDAGAHRSPNAGWPEAAIAGALGLRLNGPRHYAGVRRDDPWTGDGRPTATLADLHRALRLYRTACLIEILAVLALCLI